MDGVNRGRIYGAGLLRPLIGAEFQSMSGKFRPPTNHTAEALYLLGKERIIEHNESIYSWSVLGVL